MDVIIYPRPNINKIILIKGAQVDNIDPLFDNMDTVMYPDVTSLYQVSIKLLYNKHVNLTTIHNRLRASPYCSDEDVI